MNVQDRVREIGWRRVVNVGLKVLLVLVVLPFVLVVLPQLVGATNSYIVLSNSMADEPAPVIEAGDVIFVYETPVDQIAVGDIVTFRSGPEQMTTHRVVGVRETESGLAFETKGDANEEADPVPIPQDRIIGTVGFYVPWIGHVLAFAQTTNGLIALVIVPSALLVLFEVVDLGRYIWGSPEEPELVENSQHESTSEDIHD